jgi:hypothetical protein
MKDVDNKYLPKVTEPADREASTVAVQQVSKSRDIPALLAMFVPIALLILWLLGVGR